MTFLTLHNKIIQTRKARRGTQNRIDYFAYDDSNEEFYMAVYKKALSVANKVIKHYEETGEISTKDKIEITFK